MSSSHVQHQTYTKLNPLFKGGRYNLGGRCGWPKRCPQMSCLVPEVGMYCDFSHATRWAFNCFCNHCCRSRPARLRCHGDESFPHAKLGGSCEEMMFLQPSTIIHPKIKVPSCWFIASSGITKPVFPPPNQWIWMDMAWLAQGMGIEPLASFPPGYRPQSHRAHPTFGSPCWTGPD